MASPASLELIRVTKRYGSTVAVDAIDLKIPAGTYCCLLGPSGCGKTSTLRMIAGHEEVSGGDIVLTTTEGIFTSGLGAHLTWTLPFGLLIMFAVFNRFDARYEEAARDLGASSWQTFRHVVLPMIAPSLVGIGLFGFTLSWDEVARSSQAMGSDQNTLPLELTGLTTTVTNPEIYALGTMTTGVSLLVIVAALLTMRALARAPARPAG